MTPRLCSAVAALVAAITALVTAAARVGGDAQATAAWVAATAGPWRPPVVLVDRGVNVDQDDAQAIAEQVARDPRGWRRHLDSYAVRIVRSGTNGTQPMPGTIGLAHIDDGVAVISDEAWTQVGVRFAAIGGTLDDQRIWILSHEIGHLIHRSGDHTECPGPGEPAPVMRAVSYEIGKCALNVWPNPL